MRRALVIVENSMQSGYKYLREANPKETFRFRGALSPEEMLSLGVFEGRYLDPVSFGTEYPLSWKKNAKLARADMPPDPAINAMGVKSRMPLSAWKSAGWIRSQDPRGWFEWYCRYSMGRNSPDDYRQIARWRSFARHSGQVKKNGGGDPFNRLVQRQALLQWSRDPFPDIREPRLSVYEKAVKYSEIILQHQMKTLGLI